MGRAIFKPIPVDEGFYIVLPTLPNEPYSHERNCEKRGRRPNYVTKAIESDSSLSWFMPLPEKMDHDTWMELIHRMTDAWETYCLHCQNASTMGDDNIRFTLCISISELVLHGHFL